MPDRTPNKDRVNIEVPRHVRQQLRDYKAQLKRETGRTASMGEILSVMLSGTPTWQTHAMLDAYRPQDDLGSGEGSGAELQEGTEQQRERTRGVRVRWTRDRYTSFSEVDGFVKYPILRRFRLRLPQWE